MKVKILGKYIGTAEGWDQVGDTEVFIYSCDTSGMYPDMDGDFGFCWISGEIRKYNDDTGEVMSSVSIIDVLK